MFSFSFKVKYFVELGEKFRKRKILELNFVVRNHVQIANDAYEAAKDSHALVICTEWDEFKVNNNRMFFLIIFIFI